MCGEKMVFGIGEGKIDLQLAKMNYAKGEKISGKIILDLSKMKKAKQLVVILTAAREERSTRMDLKGRKTSSTTVKTLYSNQVILSGEQEYNSGKTEYEFSIEVPNQDLSAGPKESEGMAKTLYGVAQALGGAPAYSPIKWLITVKLDLPMSFDISKAVQISVA